MFSFNVYLRFEIVCCIFYLHLGFVGCIFNVCLGLKLDVVSAQTLCNRDLVVSLVCGRYPLLLPMLLDVLGSALHLRVACPLIKSLKWIICIAVILLPEC